MARALGLRAPCLCRTGARPYQTVRFKCCRGRIAAALVGGPCPGAAEGRRRTRTAIMSPELPHERARGARPQGLVLGALLLLLPFELLALGALFLREQRVGRGLLTARRFHQLPVLGLLA